MSYKENAAAIGKTGTIRIGGLVVDVKILDYKNTYGHDRWLVTPVAGKDQVWIEDVDIA